jgi:hypothetical protein
VRWDVVTGVDLGGDADQLVYVRVRETGGAVRSVQPATDRNRRRAWIALSNDDGQAGDLVLDPSTVCLDAATLARAITAAANGQTPRAN